MTTDLPIREQFEQIKARIEHDLATGNAETIAAILATLFTLLDVVADLHEQIELHDDFIRALIDRQNT